MKFGNRLGIHFGVLYLRAILIDVYWKRRMRMGWTNGKRLQVYKYLALKWALLNCGSARWRKTSSSWKKNNIESWRYVWAFSLHGVFTYLESNIESRDRVRMLHRHQLRTMNSWNLGAEFSCQRLVFFLRRESFRPIVQNGVIQNGELMMVKKLFYKCDIQSSWFTRLPSDVTDSDRHTIENRSVTTHHSSPSHDTSVMTTLPW